MGTALWHKHPVLCFKSNSYYGLFFRQLFDYAAHQKLLPAELGKIDIAAIDKKALQATLSQTMLGASYFYWLGNISALPAKNKELVLSYAATYQGPHVIALFVDDNEKVGFKAKDAVIEIPAMVDFILFEELAKAFNYILVGKKREVAQQIFSLVRTINLDEACMLYHYLELVSSKAYEEYVAYLAQLVGASPSLQQLSEAFFARNAQEFFRVWSMVYHEYPEMFWVVFWSEQVWRAYHVVQFLTKKDFVAAKRMSFRLPYSFVNRDWKKAKAAELSKFYERLYSIDFAIKQGSTFYSLDFLYFEYFLDKVG